ncbi:MAG: hypothetical protein AAFQ41_04155 [Cyanobacteria bacterium J06623_7]
MSLTFKVPCPNCGGSATRSYFSSSELPYSNCPQNQILRVECADCDYLMVMCLFSGAVVEAYDSSTSFHTRQRKLQTAIEFPISA